MRMIDMRPPKLCSAAVGDVVQIEDVTYIVCAVNAVGKRKARPISLGLYDDERPLFLVNLASGEAVPMPHLSSRVEIRHDAQLTLGVAK
jgi:hypothetical protein